MMLMCVRVSRKCEAKKLNNRLYHKNQIQAAGKHAMEFDSRMAGRSNLLSDMFFLLHLNLIKIHTPSALPVYCQRKFPTGVGFGNESDLVFLLLKLSLSFGR